METLITQLAEQGIAYLLLALSITGNIFLYRECKGTMEKRIEDIKESRDVLLEPIKGIKQTVDLILSAVSNKG
jgi:hypothetical protein